MFHATLANLLFRDALQKLVHIAQPFSEVAYNIPWLMQAGYKTYHEVAIPF